MSSSLEMKAKFLIEQINMCCLGTPDAPLQIKEGTLITEREVAILNKILEEFNKEDEE